MFVGWFSRSRALAVARLSLPHSGGIKLAAISFELLVKAVSVPKCHALRRTDRGVAVPLVLPSVATVVAAVLVIVSR